MSRQSQSFGFDRGGLVAYAPAPAPPGVVPAVLPADEIPSFAPPAPAAPATGPAPSPEAQPRPVEPAPPPLPDLIDLVLRETVIQSAPAAPESAGARITGAREAAPRQAGGRELRARVMEVLLPHLRAAARDPAARRALAEQLARDIARLDEVISEQVNAVLHHPRYQKLEASWRGLRMLVDVSDPGDGVRVRFLDVSWAELARDADLSMEFDQTHLFQKVYEEEFGTAGGEPFGVLIGDYEVRHRPAPGHPTDDVAVLRSVAQVATAAFCPFITAAHPSLLGLEDFGQLDLPLDLARTFAQPEYIKRRALRESEEARFLGLALPRTLMRLPIESDVALSGGEQSCRVEPLDRPAAGRAPGAPAAAPPAAPPAEAPAGPRGRPGAPGAAGGRARSCRVVVHVGDAGSDCLAGARVQLVSAARTFAAPTGATGSAAFQIPADTYRLEVEMPGRRYLPTPHAVDCDAAFTVGMATPQAFCFRERVEGPDCRNYLWGNAAFAFATVLVRGFSQTRWFADIRGVRRGEEGGGLVTALPAVSLKTDAPGVALQPPLEVAIADARERGLSDLGLIPLCPCKDTEYGAFYTNQSLHQAATYTDGGASANAKISAMLQYVLCASRVAHYLKVMGRDRIGSYLEPDDLRDLLSNWLNKYTVDDANASPEIKARYPLRAASVNVRENPAKPGAYFCEMLLQPHAQLDELAAGLRLVTELAPVGRS